MTDRQYEEDRRMEVQEEARLDSMVPAYIVIEYDVRGRENYRHSFIDVSEDEARDSFEESVEELTENNEVECKVELWTGKIVHNYIPSDYGTLPQGVKTYQETFVEKDELIETKDISWRK